MKRDCLSATELVDATLDTAADDARQHLAACRTCGGRVALLRRVAGSGARLADIGDVMQEVDALLTRLFATPRTRWWRILREPEYQRADVVRRLGALADAVSLNDRRRAVALITAATQLVDALSASESDLGDLRFETWKLASAILREAGRYRETEHALARAEVAARSAADPELAEASVLFYRALLFAEPDVWRPDEAADLLDRVEPVFGRSHATRQQALVSARALLLYRAGEFDQARVNFETVLATTPATARTSYLEHLSNVMAARVELGETDDEVCRQLNLLIDENTALGRKTHVARARWLMGKVRRLRGEYQEAAELLVRAMREIGDSDSAIRVGLDLLETFLLDDRHEEALLLARDLAVDAAALDQREPTRRRTLTAAVFAYAQEVAGRGALTADLVAELSRYVDRINRQRATDFIPPMPLADM